MRLLPGPIHSLRAPSCSHQVASGTLGPYLAQGHPVVMVGRSGAWTVGVGGLRTFRENRLKVQGCFS